MFLRKLLFWKRFEIDPYPVRDTVVFKNGDKEIELTVKSDGGEIVRKIQKANVRLSNITDKSTDEEKQSVSFALASSIFGDDQAKKLCSFYDDPVTIVTVCGRYFKERLSKKIAKAQKK